MTTPVDRMASRIHFDQSSFAISDLVKRGARAAAGLRAHGIGRGATIAILLRNEPRLIEAVECIRCLEGQRVMVPWHLATAELAAWLKQLAPKVVIAHRDLLFALQDVRLHTAGTLIVALDTPPLLASSYGVTSPAQWRADVGIDWEDLVMENPELLEPTARTMPALVLTSGSTGPPKVISWSDSQPWTTRAVHRNQDRPPIHRSIVTAPLYHGAQYGVFRHAVHQGADIVLMAKFDALDFLRLVERYRVNHAYMVPTMFFRLLRLPEWERRQHDAASLNHVLHTGSPCPPHTKRRMIEWLGPVLWESYGCSELNVISSCSSTEWLDRPGTVGRPLLPVEIRDTTDHSCAPGNTGRVFVRTTQLPALRLHERADKLSQDQREDWFSPGDAGYLDIDGYLYLTGRTDELINTGRVKVYPREIENVLLEHPDIRDCVAFALPDPEFGEQIAATVTTESEALGLPADLGCFLKDRLSAHKIPSIILPIEATLRTPTGKVNHGAIQELLRAAWPDFQRHHRTIR